MENNNGRGIGFIGLLTVAFIVLKLCGIIKWSWWIVLLPIWVEIAIIVISALVVFWLR